MAIATNWYVLTGGPSAGKTKTLEYLAFLGHPTVPESARILLDVEMSKGRSLDEIRPDPQDPEFDRKELAFQRKVFDLKLIAENRVPPERLTFLDRGTPDTVAYYRFNHFDPTALYEHIRLRTYRGIFLLDPLPYDDSDRIRTETQEQSRALHEMLHAVYAELNYRLVRVPPMPIDERAEFILSLL